MVQFKVEPTQKARRARPYTIMKALISDVDFPLEACFNIWLMRIHLSPKMKFKARI